MWKKYSYVPKTLVLNLKFQTREKNIEFTEPTMYDLLVFEEKVQEQKYLGALEYLGIEIAKKDLLSNPEGIMKAIFTLCYGKQEKRNTDPAFLPSLFDILGQRYGKTPIEILKEITPSTLDSYLAGYEYNINIEADKKSENYKFKEKKKLSTEDIERYDKIMDRVNGAGGFQF